MLSPNHSLPSLKVSLFDRFRDKAPPNEPDIPLTGPISLTQVLQVNLTETNDFEDFLNDLQIIPNLPIQNNSNKMMKLFVN